MVIWLLVLEAWLLSIVLDGRIWSENISTYPFGGLFFASPVMKLTTFVIVAARIRIYPIVIMVDVIFVKNVAIESSSMLHNWFDYFRSFKMILTQIRELDLWTIISALSSNLIYIHSTMMVMMLRNLV